MWHLDFGGKDAIYQQGSCQVLLKIQFVWFLTNSASSCRYRVLDNMARQHLNNMMQVRRYLVSSHLQQRLRKSSFDVEVWRSSLKLCTAARMQTSEGTPPSLVNAISAALFRKDAPLSHQQPNYNWLFFVFLYTFLSLCHFLVSTLGSMHTYFVLAHPATN